MRLRVDPQTMETVEMVSGLTSLSANTVDIHNAVRDASEGDWISPTLTASQLTETSLSLCGVYGKVAAKRVAGSLALADLGYTRYQIREDYRKIKVLRVTDSYLI